MIAALIMGVIQLIMIAWFGFIGVLMATICDDLDDCEYACLDSGGVHHEDKCTSPGGSYGQLDCCASAEWNEPKTCAPGFSVGRSTEKQKEDEAITEFCDMMGLMTLTAIARFGLVLTITTTSCCSLCCGYGKAPPTQQVVVMQQPVPPMMQQQPMAVQAQPVAVQPVAVQPVVAKQAP